MVYTKVVIVGGGFGGLNTALALKKANADILVIDKTNHHVFQPLLYQVATAALSSGTIAIPIREILRYQNNTSVIMANVIEVVKSQNEVLLSNGEVRKYDYLIIAAGASHSYFGHNEWEQLAPGLKTIADAESIRERVLMAFEHAEMCDSISEAEKYLNFVIIGAGPTGVEMAGAIAEISRKTLLRNFRKIKPEQAKIFLIEGLPQVLPSYPTNLGEKAREDLEHLGVYVMTNTRVSDVTLKGVYIGEKCIETQNIIWAAGNEASPLLKTLGVPLDRQGRVIVDQDMSIPDHPEIFVIGDSAAFADGKGGYLPGIAPVAIQQGRYAAKVIRKKIPKEKRTPFTYHDKGNMATIGKAKAVAVIGKMQFSGFFAWLTWCFIHILYLISFRNKVIVLVQWMFWYMTGQRNVRVIAKSIDEIEKPY